MHALHSALRRRASSAALLVACACALGCSSAGQNLKPAAAATKAVGLKDAAMAADHDVVVVVQSGAWPGESRVLKAVTPLRVRITNGNTQPVRIRYEDLSLLAADGTRYVALPTVAPQSGADARPAGAQSALQNQQNFTYSGFEIAPHLAATYPGIDVYHGAFDYDPQYYDKYARAWKADWLPTPQVKSWALPEGVLESGGYIEGFVYFQRVDKNEGVVRFEVEAHKVGDANETVAKLSIPFIVGG